MLQWRRKEGLQSPGATSPDKEMNRRDPGLSWRERFANEMWLPQQASLMLELALRLFSNRSRLWRGK